MRRKRVVNKHKAAKKFNKQVSRTKIVNINPKPMRGGIRM